MAEDGDRRTLLQNEYVGADEEIRPDPELNASHGLNVEHLGDFKPYTISDSQGQDNNYRRLNEPVYLNTSHSILHHAIVVFIVAGTAAILTVLFPTYLSNFNVKSDAYCAIVFCSLISWIFISLAAFVLKLWRRSLTLRPLLPTKRIGKIGFYYGLSGLAIFYGRDRYRVGCHLQDPLAAVILPAAVICHLFSPRVDSVSKFVCIASAIIGLFICVDFQIWDEFSCHGNAISTNMNDGGNWTSDEHIIWTMIYLAGFGLLALFINLLEWEIKSKLLPYSSSTIPMMPYEGNTNLALIEEPQPSTSEDCELPSPVSFHSKSSVEPPKPHFGHAVVICMWLQLVSTVTILALFWTDFFSFLGKAGSSDGFQQMMSAGFSCIFGLGSDLDESCHFVTLISWPFVFVYVVFFVAIVYLMIIATDCSSSYVVGILTLALPLSTLCWSFFMTENVFRWAPSFSGETGFTIVGFPIMVVALVLYKYYSEREKICIIEA